MRASRTSSARLCSGTNCRQRASTGRIADGPCCTTSGSARGSSSTARRSRSNGNWLAPTATRIIASGRRFRRSARGAARRAAPATGRRRDRRSVRSSRQLSEGRSARARLSMYTIRTPWSRATQANGTATAAPVVRITFGRSSPRRRRASSRLRTRFFRLRFAGECAKKTRSSRSSDCTSLPSWLATTQACVRSCQASRSDQSWSRCPPAVQTSRTSARSGCERGHRPDAPSASRRRALRLRRLCSWRSRPRTSASAQTGCRVTIAAA